MEPRSGLWGRGDWGGNPREDLGMRLSQDKKKGLIEYLRKKDSERYRAITEKLGIRK